MLRTSKQQTEARIARLEAVAAAIRSLQDPSVAPNLGFRDATVGLTFYLVETQPAKYAEYLQRTARRPPFREYSTSERLDDFTGVFGDDWPMLESQMLRFLNSPELTGAK